MKMCTVLSLAVFLFSSIVFADSRPTKINQIVLDSCYVFTEPTENQISIEWAGSYNPCNLTGSTVYNYIQKNKILIVALDDNSNQINQIVDQTMPQSRIVSKFIVGCSSGMTQEELINKAYDAVLADIHMFMVSMAPLKCK